MSIEAKLKSIFSGSNKKSQKMWSFDCDHNVIGPIESCPKAFCTYSGDIPCTHDANAQKARVVWANDNMDIRNYMEKLLHSRYDLEMVPDSKMALDVVRRQLPDLILVDVTMTQPDGFGLLHAIRSDKHLRLIPVLLLSSRDGAQNLAKGMGSGGDDYLIKPFSARELIARIDSLMNMARLRASEAKLEDELADARQLQRISSCLIEEHNLEALYEQILDAAMAIVGADYSCIQFYDEAVDELELLAARNFPTEAAMAWKKVPATKCPTAGLVVRIGKRVIHPNINAADMLQNTEALQFFKFHGINAIQSTPLTSRDGKRIGIISTYWRNHHEPSERDLALLDVLARQTADDLEHRRAHAVLQETDRRKDEFLAVLAHELRNPLVPVKNAIYLLQQPENSPANSQHLIQMMERQVNHMVRLVDDLLEVARIATGKIELHREKINLSSIINNALEVSKPLLESNQHRLIVSLPPEPLMVNADMVRMTQVFANLLNNAAKYTPIKGVITVNAFRDNETIFISVGDNGIGISAEMLPKVFEMFTQDKHMVDSNNRGLGIGLAMVRSIVELHGGSVKANSAGHGQGSDFTVTLPVVEVGSMTNKQSKEMELEKKSSLASVRVLIVDDNPDITNSFALLLKCWEVHVHAVNNGQSALEILDDFKPHIILLDIGMPGMDGYEVAKRIRKNPLYDSIKLVALTGWSQAKDREKSKASGFNEHLAKPVDINALKMLLNKLLD